MKKALLTVALLLTACAGFSQVVSLNKPTRIGLFGGAGLATHYNYDVGVSGGLDMQFWIHNRTYLGALLFLQGQSLYFDNEAYGAKHGTGVAGATYRHESKYFMVCPKYSHLMVNKYGFFNWLNLYAGVGFKMSGYDSVRKWDHGYDALHPSYFDSTIDASANLKSMVIRAGIAFAQDIQIGRTWWFTFREDFGFVAGGVTTTGHIDAGSPSRNQYIPNKISPAYISLQLGITRIKGKK